MSVEQPYLNRLQAEHYDWCNHNFPGARPWEFLLGMQEELGEVSHAFLKDHQQIRGNEDHYAAMCDGVGDLVIYLAGFCNAAGIDLAEAVESTWQQVKQRDWVAYPEKGVPGGT